MDNKAIKIGLVIAVLLLALVWFQKERAAARHEAMAAQTAEIEDETQAARRKAAASLSEIEQDNADLNKVLSKSAREQMDTFRKDAEAAYQKGKEESERNDAIYERKVREAKSEEEAAEWRRRWAEARQRWNESVETARRRYELEQQQALERSQQHSDKSSVSVIK
ncbi:hypothetical protein ABWL39_12415 [Chitinivorax sp. PXF-14]|uniref:hypothetical protein n=1 Tax=Chitinivorax sp. PXF-14 TaxID=3230488 RepID=UPI003466AC55